MRFFNTDKLTAIEAKQEAQKIAFAPFIFQASKALRDLGILKVIEESGEEGIGLNDILEKLALSRYGVRVLVEAGLGMGLLIIREKNYTLTKLGHFILNDPMTIVNMDFVHDVNYEGFFHLQECITTGKPVGLKSIAAGKSTVYEALATLPTKVKDSWFNFDHFYSDAAFQYVLPLVFKDKVRKVMDVGANTGKWALQCTAYNSDISVTMCDLPGQLNVALQNMKNNGLENRVQGHAIDLLDPDTKLPAGHDVIWMSQFLDCFSEDEIVMILKKAADVMQDGDRLFILETYWDRQKYENAAFCLQQTSLYFTCIANGNSQMYHADVMHECIKKAGLAIVQETDHLGISHTLTECVKI